MSLPTSYPECTAHCQARLHSGHSRPASRRSLAVLLLLLATLAEAGPFRLVSGTVDAGGAHSQGSRFAVEGTVGQPDAGLAQGARFSVDGGFWPTTATSAAPTDSIFRNSFED